MNSTTSQLIVSNHLSYLDVVIMAAQKPLVFVTSIEIKNTPFLGQITELAGCLYVERRSRANLNIEINDIKEGLSHNLSVCVFPEATSTNGDTVLRFKRPLFHAALMAERPVLPLCLNYLTINNKKVDIHNRDNVAWYGDMDFFPHLIGVMQKKNITVALCIENEILPTQHITADELALASHHAVSKMFRPLSLSFE